LDINAAAARLSSSDLPEPTDLMASCQFHAPDVLDHVAAGAGQDGVEHRLLVGEGGQDQAAQPVVGGQQVPAQIDAAAIGQAHVQHRDVGPGRRDAGLGLGDRTRLADDGQFGVAAEQVDEAAANDLMVVDQEDGDHGPTLIRKWLRSADGSLSGRAQLPSWASAAIGLLVAC
jgi:hypothetical protein